MKIISELTYPELLSAHEDLTVYHKTGIFTEESIGKKLCAVSGFPITTTHLLILERLVEVIKNRTCKNCKWKGLNGCPMRKKTKDEEFCSHFEN